MYLIYDIRYSILKIVYVQFFGKQSVGVCWDDKEITVFIEISSEVIFRAETFS